MTSLEKDTLSRRRIVSEIDQNFFVEAGAGSGKTTMLTCRMAAMVEAGVDIGKICAITFTRAAAGEFYERFQRLLALRSRPGAAGEPAGGAGILPEPTELTRERCRRALRNIDLCFMGTIDSFCQMILSEHPSEAGIPSDASVATDAEAAAFYRQQYVKICAGEYGEELQSLAKTFQAVHRDPQEVFARGMAFLMNNRNVLFRFHEAAGADIDRVFAGDREQVIRAAECLLEHGELKYDKEAKSRAAWEQITDIWQQIRGRWSSRYISVLQGLKTLKNIRLIPEAAARYGVSLEGIFVPGGKQGKWLEWGAGGEGGLLEKLQKFQYDVSMTFLTRCVPVMEQALRSRGSLTFFDGLYDLRNMLKEDAEGEGGLIRYIYGRHSYFLIDEFQDTNPLQAEIFFYLTAAKPVPRWSDCVPRPGSLFIVGDPKQSIYRFRGADVTSFLKVKRLFADHGGAVLSLSRNFRSKRSLCGYFNQVFSALLPEETENQSRFEQIPLPEPSEDEFQGVFTYKAYTGAAVSAQPDMADPVRIAGIIERLTGSARYRIREERSGIAAASPGAGEEQGSLRPIRYRDFMVITYGKKKLGPILAELAARNIPTRVEGDVPFAGNEALSELRDIYAAAADPDERAALYGALTGSRIALTQEDLLAFRSCGGVLSLRIPFDREACHDAAALRTADWLDRLRGLQAKAQRLSPAALFSRVMDEFRFLAGPGAENPEVLYYALELLRNAETSGEIVTLKDGARFLEQLIAGETDQERCLSLTDEQDCVHLANLHKVKGLEAPIVILAGAGDRARPARWRIAHGDDGSEGVVFSLESVPNENGIAVPWFATSEFPDEKTAETEDLAAEERRLIYVAATRAKSALIICASARISRGKESLSCRWSPLISSGLLDIFDILEPDSPAGRPCDPADPYNPAGKPRHLEDLYGQAESTCALNNRQAETPTFRVANPSRQSLPAKPAQMPEAGKEEAAAEATAETPAEAATEATAEAAGGHRFGALLGTMTHRLMEMLVTARNRVDASAAVRELLREYRTAETEGCERELSDMLLQVAGRIRGGGYPQTNAAPQDILGTLLAADEVYCEVPFCYRDETEESTVWSGMMDAVYAKDGQWHIVDYKTNADGSGLDARYQAQLSAYREAFKAITGCDADALTYHIDI